MKTTEVNPTPVVETDGAWSRDALARYAAELEKQEEERLEREVREELQHAQYFDRLLADIGIPVQTMPGIDTIRVDGYLFKYFGIRSLALMTRCPDCGEEKIPFYIGGGYQLGEALGEPATQPCEECLQARYDLAEMAREARREARKLDMSPLEKLGEAIAEYINYVGGES